MSGGRRDVESDIRHLLAGDAKWGVTQLRTTNVTTVDAVLDYLVSRSYSNPQRLLEAHAPLGEEDQGARARALLLRASRRAADPQPSAPPRPFSPPDAPPPA